MIPLPPPLRTSRRFAVRDSDGWWVFPHVSLTCECSNCTVGFRLIGVGNPVWEKPT